MLLALAIRADESATILPFHSFAASPIPVLIKSFSSASFSTLPLALIKPPSYATVFNVTINQLCINSHTCTTSCGNLCVKLCEVNNFRIFKFPNF